MSKPEPLDRLIDVARARAEEAGEGLRRLIAQRGGAQEQLSTLETYRRDYALRLHDAGHAGITASNYHNFSRFLDTLDEAIVQQTGSLTQLDRNILRKQENFRVLQARLHSFEALNARQAQQRVAQESRREQQLTDELCAVMHRRAGSEEDAS